MEKPFLIAETPRGGRFGHRFIVPPVPDLRSTKVEACFRSAALGRGNDFVTASRQVKQNLHNAVREGTETLLLTGLAGNNLGQAGLERLREQLNQLLPKLEKLIVEEIDWEKAGERTMIVRDELDTWLRRDLAETITRSDPTSISHETRTADGPPRKERTALFIGTLLGLAAGLLTLFIWFF